MVFYFVLNLNLWNIDLNDESIVDIALPDSRLGAYKGTTALINTRERNYTRPRLLINKELKY